MRKRIFQVGNYPQGNVTIKDLQEYVEHSRDAPIILGHVNEWSAYKIPRTAIPRAGTMQNFSIDGEWLIADLSINEFGNTIIADGAYSEMSIGFRGDKIDHLALLGYAEPACKYIDSISKNDLAFAEDTTEVLEYAITINIEEGKKGMTLEELKKAITDSVELTKEEKKELTKELIKTSNFGIDEKTSIIEETMGEITAEEKSKMQMALGWGSYTKLETKEEKLKVFGELTKEFAVQVKAKTYEDGLREAKEIADEEARKTKEFADAEVLIKTKVFPAYQEQMKDYAKILVETKDAIEFSDANGTVVERGYDRFVKKLEAITEFDTKDFAIVAGKKDKTDAEKIQEIAEETAARYNKK